MLVLLLTLLAQTPDSGAASDSSKRDIVYYAGKRVIFYAKSEEVVLLDSAWVRYRGMSVYSDSIHYDVKRHVLSAHRDVLFSSGTENITGVLLTYDIDIRKGMMRTAHTKVENGYFFANEVWLVREKVLNAHGGSYTTCNLDHPHYAFYGPRVRLYMDDVAITEPVLLKVGRTPILAAPFWLVPVASKRKSGLLPFKVGNSSTEGYYSKNMSYYWVINDYSDMTFHADLMTKKGLQGRAEALYVVNPFANGNIKASYIQEWDTHLKRYSVSGQHESQFLFGSSLAAQVDMMSDATYVPDYGEEKLDWLKPDLYSYAEVSRQIRRVGKFTATAWERTEFRKHRRYGDLPSVGLSFSSRPLGGGWTTSPSLSFARSFTTLLDSTNTIDSVRELGLKGKAGLSTSSPAYSLGPLGTLTIGDGLSLTEQRSYLNDSLSGRPRHASHSLNLAADQRFPGAFRLAEGLGLTQTDDLADSRQPVSGYSGSLSGSIELYRVFGTEAFGLRALRHSVTPGIGLSYQPRVDSGLFGRPRFDDSAAAVVSASVRNSFAAKVGVRETLTEKRDLGYLNLTTGYDLLRRQASPLRAVASLSPLQGSNLSLTLNTSAGYYLDSLKPARDYELSTAFAWKRTTTDTLTNWERGFDLHLGHTLGRNASGDLVHMIRGSLVLSVPGWKLHLSEFGYNFAESVARRRVTNYKIQLTKDLHCWEALTSLQRLGGRWSYDFEIRIKKLPDVKFGKSTFGSLLPRLGEQ